MPGAEVEGIQLGQRLGADQAATVAGAVEPPIVYADQVPVAGEPDVALQPVGAFVQRAQVRTERMLRQCVGPAAMSEDQR
jgi:hypothetical protein